MILITSASRREGKTTLASLVANAIASTGQTVIICDFDLRAPTLHRLHGVEATPGICEVLRGEVELPVAVKRTERDNLMLLTAGTCCSDAIAALGQERLTPVIRELREMADVVIIDGCPVLTSADINYVSPEADLILLAVRRDVSRMPAVNSSLRLLRSCEKRVAGAVVIERDAASNHISSHY